MGKIVWIASYPKSGNTWTRAFLHNLFAGGETAYDINKMDKLSSNEAATANYAPFEQRPWQEWSPTDVAADFGLSRRGDGEGNRRHGHGGQEAGCKSVRHDVIIPIRDGGVTGVRGATQWMHNGPRRTGGRWPVTPISW